MLLDKVLILRTHSHVKLGDVLPQTQYEQDHELHMW